jgi:hypothetical protein
MIDDVSDSAVSERSVVLANPMAGMLRGYVYSAECVEKEKFSEVRGSKLDRLREELRDLGRLAAWFRE